MGGQGCCARSPASHLLFQSQRHHWFTRIGRPRRSLHGFLSLGFPEANSLRVVHLPHPHLGTQTERPPWGERGAGSGGGGAFRRQEGAGGSEALTSPGSSLSHRVPRADAISGPRTHLVRQRAIAACLRGCLPQEDVLPLELRDNTQTPLRRSRPAAGWFPLPTNAAALAARESSFPARAAWRRNRPPPHAPTLASSHASRGGRPVVPRTSLPPLWRGTHLGARPTEAVAT